MIKSTLLAAAATLLLAGTASAQDTRAGGRLDRDGDKRVSLAELQAAQAERFTRLDTNRDGQLTRDERQAGRQAMRAERAAQRVERQAEMFSRRDADRDGGLSLAEAPKKIGPHFAHVDADRNGRLSPQELQAARTMLRGERGPKSVKADRPRVDANGDGAVSRAEFDAQLRVRFARMDADRDGFITRAERKAVRQQRRG
jgi:Ca2+-binding EF-hand superfamily protein